MNATNTNLSKLIEKIVKEKLGNSGTINFDLL